LGNRFVKILIVVFAGYGGGAITDLLLGGPHDVRFDDSLRFERE
jgi:hypothetical protein